MPIESENWVGRTVADRYEVGALLGEGGMGQVFRAHDARLKTDVVLKVPKRAVLAEPEFAARFKAEIRSLVQLTHPHIVKVSDVGDDGGTPFIVMQYLPGGSLDDRLRKLAYAESPVGIDELIGWLPAIASALDFIHSQGYLHRDVKPANILFDQHGNAYLSDFGIAKAYSSGTASRTSASLTGTGLVVGTPDYLAPELIMGSRKCDGRADLYSLAATLYETLCGGPPFAGAAASAVLVMHATTTPISPRQRNPSVSSQLDAAVMRGLAKKPEERFKTCTEFANSARTADPGKPIRVTAKASAADAEKGTKQNATSETLSVLEPTAIARPTRAVPRSKQRAPARQPLVKWAFIAISTFVAAVAAYGFGTLTVRGTEVDPEAILQELTPPARIDNDASFTNILGMRMLCIRAGWIPQADGQQSDKTLQQTFWISQEPVSTSQFVYFLHERLKGTPTATHLIPAWVRKAIDEQVADIHSENKTMRDCTPAQWNAFSEWLSQRSANNSIRYETTSAGDERLAALNALRPTKSASAAGTPIVGVHIIAVLTNAVTSDGKTAR